MFAAATAAHAATFPQLTVLFSPNTYPLGHSNIFKMPLFHIETETCRRRLLHHKDSVTMGCDQTKQAGHHPDLQIEGLSTTARTLIHRSAPCQMEGKTIGGIRKTDVQYILGFIAVLCSHILTASWSITRCSCRASACECSSSCHTVVAA